MEQARSARPARADEHWDVLVVGGGPAGLSAALVLGRCRRRVLVCDTGRPRNARAREVHAFFTRDGTPPLELVRAGRAQLARYDGVELRSVEVTDIRRRRRGFEARTADGGRVGARFVLLATGVVDRLPVLRGLEPLYGRSVFHCPYCDGWEVRDLALAVYGRGHSGAGLATELLAWSRDVVLCTDGPARLSPGDAQRLARLGIPVRAAPIARLRGRGSRLVAVEFVDGSTLPRDAMFLSTGQRQRSALAVRLGCAFTRRGALRVNRMEMTSVPGVYAAGDCSRDVQLVIIAAAEGARAAFAMNTELIREESVKNGGPGPAVGRTRRRRKR
jgi:thioredoxin reductase